MIRQPKSVPGQVWLLTDCVPSGPFDVTIIQNKLAAGEVSWETLACPVGDSTWLPLVQVPGFAPACAHSSGAPQPTDGSPSPPTFMSHADGGEAKQSVPTAARQAARAWDPVAIGCLGVLFTPMWAGVSRGG